MTLKIILIIAGALGIVSCSTNSGNQVDSTSDASGVYVREYTLEITNPETGRKIGVRQVRDSIFIVRRDKGYEVSNRKWRMNDYDHEGWVSMAHSEDRPLPTFFGSFDEKSRTLIPENTTVAQPIFIDEENETLFKNRSMEIAYSKIN